jgi:hypothetical protein
MKFGIALYFASYYFWHFGFMHHDFLTLNWHCSSSVQLSSAGVRFLLKLALSHTTSDAALQNSDLQQHMSTPLAQRFHAIITGPLDLSGSPGTSDHRNGYEHYGGVRFQDVTGTKRKKDLDDVGPSIPKRISRRTSEDEGDSTREVSQKPRLDHAVQLSCIANSPL